MMNSLSKLPQRCFLIPCLLLGLLAISSACDREEVIHYHHGPTYRFYIDYGSPFIGAQLYVGDERGSTVTDSMLREGYEGPMASFQPGGMESFGGREDLELRIKTPCGELRYGLTPPQEHNSTVYNLRVTVDSPTPERLRTSTVWIDPDYLNENDVTVQIGEREYTHRDVFYNNSTIAGIDCAEEHEVRIDGELVGTIDVAASRQREIGSDLELADVAFFITHDRDACYRMQSYSYRSRNMDPIVGSRSPVYYFRDSHIYNFRATDIRAFLTPAPTTVQGVATDHITELVEISCDEVEE